MRVLVCDDDAGTRAIVKHLLVRKLGCYVVECADGVGGLHAIVHDHFDFAVIDVNMPEMNGIEVVEAVRGNRAIQDLRIVMLTADCREDVVRRLLALGVSDYILKPLVADTALAKLERVKKTIPAPSAASGRTLQGARPGI